MAASKLWKLRFKRFSFFSLSETLKPFNESRSPSGKKRLFSSEAVRSVESPDREVHVPVLIVGAGPVGLFLSILLTKLGVKCAVIEKNLNFSRRPQAHFINNRSMELFRKLDGLVDEIQKFQPPVDLWRKFIYCTSLSGSLLGSVDHMQPQDFEQIVSPVSVAHFSQYKLSRLLIKRLENLDFHVRNCDSPEGLNADFMLEREILMGHECTSLIPACDHVKVGLLIQKGGTKIQRNIRCSILVGCDGSRSTVRKLVGINMKGQRDLQKLISVHFLSKDLGQYLLHHRPGMLFFIYNPEAIGVLVAHDLTQGEFVMQIPFYPPQQSLEDFSPKVCEELISKLVGQKYMDVNVVDVKPWVMHAEVAEKFVTCDNRVILVGDAAHRFPPAGGFGMNTGIQDAHNVAWKIALLLNGIAQPSLLHTYEMERKPVAIFNTELSVKNFYAAMSVPAALGLDPTVANTVHRAVNSSIGSILPSGLQKVILEGIFALGRVQVSPSLLNENNPLGSSRLAKLRGIFEEGKSLQLQFPAEDLGFRYSEGALAPDAIKTDEKTAKASPTGRKRDYIPSAKPGSRLPHMYMKDLNSSSDQDMVSTLDLVSSDRPEFLLIISPTKDSYELARAAFKVAGDYKTLLKVCVVWPHGSSGDRIFESKTELEPWNNFVNVEEVGHSSWWEICQMTNRGAILVRPDEHIAWSVESGVTGDPSGEMDMVFSVILGRMKTPL
ncbi:hypothetical protein QJS10_CPB18g00484 [Acorus calamus]|uniref:FAD-binding domain-containing protein n=1 Tax=Acorus calamus TaxID=4465 RepID=A0AAV9CM45_ACOCL|nr:hypothetical protein QJS10_CPB18g00484 [Acorus calamus]